MAMEKWYPIRWGLVLCIITILFSFVLGGWMGADENFFKGNFKQTVKVNAVSVYANDKVKMDRAEERAWIYVKRSHMHAAGLGPIGLALLAPLPFLIKSSKIKALIAIAYGLGSFGYSLSWIVSGYRIPLLGTTTAAKESIAWLAAPSIALLVLSTTAILILYIRWAMTAPKEKASDQSS